MPHLYDEHPRTLEAQAKCKNFGSCHDCAMTCKYGNQVRNDQGTLVPCGTEIFDAEGKINLCGECAQDAMDAIQTSKEK